jgi:hypothetical protein
MDRPTIQCYTTWDITKKSLSLLLRCQDINANQATINSFLAFSNFLFAEKSLIPCNIVWASDWGLKWNINKMVLFWTLFKAELELQILVISQG